MTVDTDLSTKLHERLTELIDSSKATLITALPHDKYLIACGMIESWTQIRDSLIPELLDEIQKR